MLNDTIYESLRTAPTSNRIFVMVISVHLWLASLINPGKNVEKTYQKTLFYNLSDLHVSAGMRCLKCPIKKLNYFVDFKKQQIWLIRR